MPPPCSVVRLSLPTTVGLVACAALLSGCITPQNTRLPQWHLSSTDQQRREYQQQDPFPDSAIGPDMGIRPRGFTEQRSDPLRTRNRNYSTILRQQYAPPPGLVPTGPGAQYPEAVQVH